MGAAERIFDGAFDNVADDDGDVEMATPATKESVPKTSVRHTCFDRNEAPH